MTETKKSLGQNFLRDKVILNKIVDFAQIEKNDIVVEVGPGEGTLTELLLEKDCKVIAIEKDETLIEFLKEKFTEEIKEGKLEIICGDILESEQKILERTSAAKHSEARTSERKCFLRINYKLVGNIPYYITGALFKKALESQNPPKSITFVVQKEVAERIIARDGKESILSISIKAYGKPEYGGIIKAGSFHPSPKVDSAIIAIRNINKEKFEEITPLAPLTLRGEEKIQWAEEKFFEILKAGFAHKRKILIKNLEIFEKSQKLKEIFNKLGISDKTRAEDLKVDDWICITKELRA
jgi:16S rRNA (adenine1518-N6/adenine1519-N6)-dimethyltransferase